MTAHTPAPWYVHGTYKHYVMFGEDIIAIAVPFSPIEWDEADANAHLLAAAPDLLESLGCLLPVMALADVRWKTTPEYIAAQAAIAKATGEAVSS